ncbi:PAF acetylhydrolase family protein [Rutstroemia sp. NJR-2017a WRK4]|nr:PAF acetylhydrolase family protein [Rutstroemia sp. NJR-2017a WRK4]
MKYILRPWWSILTFSLAVHGILQAPPLQGLYSLGTTVLELNDPSTSRTMMLSLFYPTTSHNTTFAPVFPPTTASYLAQAYSLPLETITSLTSRSHLNSPILHPTQPPFPTLLFSPGYGTSRLLYTCTAEELASLGYLVLTIDHPHDVSLIEYLNGTVTLTPPVDFENYTAPIPYVNARVKDLQFVLDSLSHRSFISQIPGISPSTYSSPFQTQRIGALGHSLGGAVAFSAMRADSRFAYGANLDGAVIGDVVASGLSSPFLIVGSESSNRSTDPTWADLWKHSTRTWKREVEVKGTMHDSFTDLLVWTDVLGLKEDSEGVVGTITGGRMLDLERELLGCFFGKWLKGERGRGLDGESGRWPEVGEISTANVSPSLKYSLGSKLLPTPAGVPVKMIVPGNNVVPWDRNDTIFETEKIKSLRSVRTEN